MHKRVERVYLISWATHGVFKVGYTTDPRRPKRLAERGGHIDALSDLQPGSGVAVERALIATACANFASAFRDREEAEPLLGRHGGWMECFRGDGRLMLNAIDWEWAD